MQCCADSISIPNAISLTTHPEYLIARLYTPDDPGYRLKFCMHAVQTEIIVMFTIVYRYNIQCPNETFNLYYTMVRFSVEPPDENSQCLDFMHTFAESI